MIKEKQKRKKKKTHSCEECQGLCCRYFALPIETPEDWDDYDDIRWYLCHEDVTVFVEDGDWYLNVNNKCRYLDGGARCEIYSMRPKICRKYDLDDCDKSGHEYEYEMHFLDDRQMAEYMKIKFGPKVFDKLEKKQKSPKKGGKARK